MDSRQSKASVDPCEYVSIRPVWMWVWPEYVYWLRILITYFWKVPFRSFNRLDLFGPFRFFEEEEEIGTILCAEHWCCLSSLLGYWTQSWTGRHSVTGYQQAGTHFADLGRITGRESTPPGINSTAEWDLNSWSSDPKPTTLTIKPTLGIHLEWRARRQRIFICYNL